MDFRRRAGCRDQAAVGQEKVTLTFGDNPYGYATNATIAYTALY